MYPYPGDLTRITSYGLVLAIALVTGWWLARRNARAAGIDPSHIDLLWPLAPVAGFAVLAWASDERIRLIPLIFVCTTVVFVYASLTRQSFLRLLDILAVPTIAVIALQRCGCFLAGCCWGDPAPGSPWYALAVRFPAGSFAWEQHVAAGWIEYDAVRSLPVHATQLYEAALLAPVVFFLWRFRPGRWPAGQLTLLAVGAYGLIRFAVEFFRADSAPVAGPLSVAQVLCVALLLGSIAAYRMNTNAVR